MRIVCERCAAAFTVDDARIPPAGARAACPRCRHQIVVQRPAVPNTLPDSLPPMPGARTTQPLPPDPLERDGHTTGQYAVPDAASAAYASASGRYSGQYPAPSQPSAPAPMPALPDFDLVFASGPNVAPPARTTGDFDADELFAAPATPLARITAQPPAPSTLPEAPAADDDRTEEQPAPPSDGEWRVKKAEGIVEGPFTMHELMARIEAGLLGPNDLVARGADPFQPPAHYTLTTNVGKPAPTRSVRAFASTERGPFPWRPVAAVLVIVVGVVLGAVVYTVRPQTLFGPPPTPIDAGAINCIEHWRETEPTPSASAKELFQLGRGYAAADTPEGLRRAVEAFKQTLIQSPRDVKAMAAFAEVRAIQSIEEGDELGVRESTELLGYALRHAPDQPEPHVARANILAVTGTAGDLLIAQSEAQTARRLAPDDPDVLLCVGRAYMTTNAEFALEAIEKAQKKSPELRRVPLLLGEAYLKLGRLAQARQAFEKRKELVPDDATADLMLAELDASIGRFDRARRRLAIASQKNPHSTDVRLLYATLAYQIDGDFKLARDELAALARMPLDRRRKVRVAIHQAAVAQALGQLDEAEAIVKAGQEIEPDNGAFTYRLALIRLAQGNAEEARAFLKKAADQVPDRAQKALLEGRIAAALGEVDAAQQEFGRATLLSPQRIGGYLLGAAMYAQVGAQSQALALVRRALNTDPQWAQSHRQLTEYYESDAYLSFAVGAFEALASAQDEVALTQGSLAVARYHAGDRVGAEQAAKTAVATNDGALAARLYLAQTAIDRHEPERALDHLKEALDIDRLCPTVHYLMGRAFAQLGHYDEAHGKFRDALEADPSFVPALVRDAEALAQAGQRDEAMAAYRKAYKADRDDLFARQGIDALEEGETPPPLDAKIEVEAEGAESP